MNQLSIDFAKARRDDGMQRSVEHADDVVPTWSDVALGYVHLYARRHPFFLAEDVREFAISGGLVKPPDGRSWGAVLRTAAKAGVVVRDGYAPANSSNRSPKCRWKSLVLSSAVASAA